MTLEYDNITNESFEAIKQIIKTDVNGKVSKSTKRASVKVFFTDERRVMKELHDLSAKLGFWRI